MEEQTTTQQPGRVLIAERRDKQRARMAAADRIKEAAAELAPLYAALDLGEFNAEALADVYTNGGEETRRRYLAHASEEVNKIQSGILRGSMMAGIEANTPPYFAKAKQIKRDAGSGEERYSLGYMTVTEGGATLTDEDAERLRDSARWYITNPEEIAKHRQHVELIERLNAFFEDGAALPPGWFNLFPNKNGKFIYPVDGANYAYFVQRRKDAQQQTPPPEAAPQPEDLEMRAEEPPKQQQNRKRGGVVKGIRKEPDTINRGAELRRGDHRTSPDIK